MNPDEAPSAPSLWTLIRDAHKRIHVTGAVGLYLLIATIIVLILGAGALSGQPDLKRFALVVTLLMIFFFSRMAWFRVKRQLEQLVVTISTPSSITSSILFMPILSASSFSIKLKPPPLPQQLELVLL